MKKKLLSLLMTVMMVLHAVGTGTAFAELPTITVTFLDENGNVIFSDSYQGKEFDISKIDTYFLSASSAELEAMGKASEVKLDTSYNHDLTSGPEVTASENGDGEPLTVRVTGDASRITASDGAKITFVGDLDSWVSTDAALRVTGDATVEGTGDIVSKYDGIHAEDSSNVTVDGTVRGGHDEPGTEVDSEGNPIYYGVGAGVFAEDNSSVTVKDDVHGYNDGVIAEGSANVTVDGEVRGYYGSGILALNETDSVTGEVIENNATVTVDESLFSYDSAIIAEGSAEISVGQDVTSNDSAGIVVRSGSSEEDPAKVTVVGTVTAVYDGIEARGGADVTVGGSVRSSKGNGVYVADDSTIKVEGDVIGNGRDGINAQNTYSGTPGEMVQNAAVVEVGGNVSGYMNGIVAEGTSDITVDGNVQGGHMAETTVIDAEGNETKIYDGMGYGIGADDSAAVTVKGNVRGAANGIMVTDHADVKVEGNVIANSSSGIVAYNATKPEEVIENHSKVDVQGSVTAKQHGIQAFGSAEVHVGENVMTTQGVGIFAHDEAQITVGENVYSGDDGVIANGTEGGEKGPQVTVQGTVNAWDDGVTATGDAEVSVDGSVFAGHVKSNTYTDMNGKEHISYYGEGVGVSASDSAHVTVGTAVSGMAGGVRAYGSSVVDVGDTVNSGLGYGIQAQNTSVYDPEAMTWTEKMNQAKVTVDGDVIAGGVGVDARGESKIEVHGSVTGEREIPYSFMNADGEEVTGTDITGTGVSAWDQAKVTVDGDVNAGSLGVAARNQAVVNIGGSVISKEGTAVDAADDSIGYDTEKMEPIMKENEAVINVSGDVESGRQAVYAEGKAVVNIAGDVKGNGYNHVSGVDESMILEAGAVEVGGSADVMIGGSVTVEEGPAIRVDAPVYSWQTEKYEAQEGQASVTVGGSVSSGDGAGVVMGGDAKVTIQGDVTGGRTTETPAEEKTSSEEETAEEEDPAREEARRAAFAGIEEAAAVTGAVELKIEHEGNEGQLIVGGTVSTTEGNVPVVISYTVTEESKVAEAPTLPDIKIYEIVPQDGQFFDVNVSLEKEFNYQISEEGETYDITDKDQMLLAISEEDHTAVIEAIAAAIQYIIKIDSAYQDGTIDIADEFYDSENGIYTAHEGEEVSVTLNLGSEYELTASGQYTLTDNGDGTWTLTVERGGGVTLSATIRQTSIETLPEDDQGEETGSAFRGEKEVETVVVEEKHPAVGKSVLFGRYDLDGNGEAEDLSWKVLRVAGGYARLAMETGLKEIPEDFRTAFNAWEAEQIRNGDITALDQGTCKDVFHDEEIHPSMYVKLDALNLAD